MADMEDTIYPDLASARAALDRGETVRIQMAPITLDPALVQLAQDLQDKKRLQQLDMAMIFNCDPEELETLAAFFANANADAELGPIERPFKTGANCCASQ